MTRSSWAVATRNKLSELAMGCDSCAAINGANMSRTEREELQSLIRKAVSYIDKKIF